MYILSDKFLEKNKHLSIAELIDILKEKDKKADDAYKEILKVDMSQNFIVGSLISIPFYNQKENSFTVKDMTITNEKEVIYNQYSKEVWYELDEKIWVTRFRLNQCKYYINKTDIRNAYNSIVKGDQGVIFDINNISALINHNNEFSINELISLCMFNNLLIPSEKRRLLHIAKTISMNFFRTEFNLNEFIEEEIKKLRETLKKLNNGS